MVDWPPTRKKLKLVDQILADKHQTTCMYVWTFVYYCIQKYGWNLIWHYRFRPPICLIKFLAKFPDYTILKFHQKELFQTGTKEFNIRYDVTVCNSFNWWMLKVGNEVRISNYNHSWTSFHDVGIGKVNEGLRFGTCKGHVKFHLLFYAPMSLNKSSVFILIMPVIVLNTKEVGQFDFPSKYKNFHSVMDDSSSS